MAAAVPPGAVELPQLVSGAGLRCPGCGAPAFCLPCVYFAFPPTTAGGKSAVPAAGEFSGSDGKVNAEKYPLWSVGRGWIWDPVAGVPCALMGAGGVWASNSGLDFFLKHQIV